MAGKSSKHSSLDVEEDREWQERFWTAQRVGWVGMALFILAALAGATGKGGPLASATASTADGMIHYPRISRWQASEEIKVTLPAAASGDVDLVVSPAFSRVFSVDSVVPRPGESQTTPTGQLYRFSAAAGGKKEIILHVTGGKPVINQPVDVRIGQSSMRLNVTILP